MENELANSISDFSTYLPYISSVGCAIISGITSYLASCKKSKSELKKLEKQNELDIEKEREKFAMEKEKLELEHKYQLELLQKQTENALGTNLANTVINGVITTPEFKHQISQGFRNGRKKKR
ncbi:MAG: hypothetical protein UE295_06985 [Acutalibacteraceae bacterium]|nr:hypothetical protein [Acutalibacteraceae bacterium]